MEDMTTQQKIHLYREEHHMSQEKLAELADIDTYTIWRMEKGAKVKKTTEKKVLDVINGI